MPRIYTSYYAKAKHLREAGIMPIAISQVVPSWFRGNRLRLLAPPWSIVQKIKHSPRTAADKAEYERAYITHLTKQFGKISSVIDYINVYSEYDPSKYPNGIALLCYEKTTDFCHRHILANMLNTKFRHQVVEWSDECK